MRLPTLVKRVTTPVVGRVPVTISGGPNRGMKWSLASSGNGFRRGVREPERMRLLGALVRGGDVVWDVGAHYGYVALLMARQAGPTGRLHAFEPARRSRWYLQRHVRWNALDNVTVHPYALADFDGEARFGGSDSSQLFALGGGEERVQVRSGATLIRAGACPPPTFVKVDVEGAEVEVLRGLLSDLPQSARALVAVHSAEKLHACLALMASAGFRAAAAGAIERAKREDIPGAEWPGDPDVFFYGPEYPSAQRDLRELAENGF